MSSPAPRELPLEGVYNFRDYGGYAVQGGGRLRAGRLFRSGQHGAATPADLEAISDLGLVAIVDLRGDSERRMAPCLRPEGFSAKVRFATEETAGLAPHIEAAAHADTVEGAADAMRAGYAEIPFRPRLSEALRMYFEVLAEEDGATLVHCMAGKDRTGFAVALLHALVGVHPDDIAADYLLTNTVANADARIAAGAAMMREGRGRQLSEETVRTLMGVHPSYLDAAFEAARARYGSLDAYMEEALGVTPERREAIKTRLVA